MSTTSAKMYSLISTATVENSPLVSASLNLRFSDKFANGAVDTSEKLVAGVVDTCKDSSTLQPLACTYFVFINIF